MADSFRKRSARKCENSWRNYGMCTLRSTADRQLWPVPDGMKGDNPLPFDKLAGSNIRFIYGVIYIKNNTSFAAMDPKAHQKVQNIQMAKQTYVPCPVRTTPFGIVHAQCKNWPMSTSLFELPSVRSSSMVYLPILTTMHVCCFSGTSTPIG